MKRITTLLATLILLSSCATITFTGMYKMATLDPLEINPEEFRVAVRTEKNFMVKTGQVKVAIKVINDDETIFIDDIYYPENNAKLAVSQELIDGMLPHEAVSVLQLSEKDAIKLTGTHKQLREFKENDIKHTNSFSLSINLGAPCVEDFDITTLKAAQFDIFMQTEATQEFFMFIKNLMIEDIPEAEVSDESSDANEDRCKPDPEQA